MGEYRQAQTDLNGLCKNANRVDFDYAGGRKALVCKDGILCKAKAKYIGPFHITIVHTNGTIGIEKEALSMHWNIRSVKPYFPPDPEDTDVEED